MRKLCVIEGCGKPAAARGLCGAHYQRHRRHGDELAGRPEWGEPRKWLRSHVAYEGDECLIWPFSRLTLGYPSVRIDGRLQIASRVMCEWAHGPPPKGHWAVHSCGNGHLGCVNPRHLRWATPEQNQADSIEHGTRVRGSRVGISKLTETNVRAIRAMKGQVTQRRLATEYGVSEGLISLIMSGRSWAWLK